MGFVDFALGLSPLSTQQKQNKFWQISGLRRLKLDIYQLKTEHTFLRLLYSVVYFLNIDVKNLKSPYFSLKIKLISEMFLVVYVIFKKDRNSVPKNKNQSLK